MPKKEKSLKEKTGDNLEEIVIKIIKYLDDNAKVNFEKGDGIKVNISSEDSGRLIGRYGQTLADLQYVLRMVANTKAGERVSLVVDVENYKANKSRELEELALSVADNVARSGYPQTLKPMNAYERRVIHAALNDFEGVQTSSIGEEPNRCVEVRPKAE